MSSATLAMSWPSRVATTLRIQRSCALKPRTFSRDSAFHQMSCPSYAPEMTCGPATATLVT
jgi:hypothetical protein